MTNTTENEWRLHRRPETSSRVVVGSRKSNRPKSTIKRVQSNAQQLQQGLRDLAHRCEADEKEGSLAKTGFDRQRLLAIAGLAFLWPCLQSSGFYPFSLIDAVSIADAVTVSQLHLAYSLALIAMLAAIAAMGSRFEALSYSNPAFPLVVGALGAAGHAILACSNASQLAFVSPAAAGALLVALFVATFVPLWGSRLSCGEGKQATFAIALSYLASQLTLTVCFAAEIPQGLLLSICAAGSAICAVLSANDTAPSRTFSSSSLRALPWRMIGLVVLLIYFCIIYVRLQSGEFSGDVEASRKLLASVICLLIFAVVTLCLMKRRTSDNGFIVVFIFLVSAYMVALALVALIPGDNGSALARRMLIAGEHCLEVFLWMTIVSVVIRRRLAPIPVFATFGIVVVALPWMLSFDLRYLAGFAEAFSSSDFSTPVVTVALCATALGTIAFLTSYALQMARESSEQAIGSQQEAAQKALDGLGLTQRELEIASLVSQGHSAKKIAAKLYVSEPTVKSYTSRVYRKLGIHSKQELIDYVNERKPEPR